MIDIKKIFDLHSTHDPPGGSKKRYLAAGLVVLLCLAVFGATYAMLKKNTNSLVNNFNIGTPGLEVEEPGVDPGGVDWGDDTKPVKLKNTGNIDSVLRVTILPVFKTTGSEGAYTGGSTDYLQAPDGKQMILGDLVFYFEEAFVNGVSDHWVFNPADGYFYYRKVVEPGGETEQILSGVTLVDDELAEKYQGISVEVKVFADSLQAGGGAPAKWDASIDTNGNVTYGFGT